MVPPVPVIEITRDQHEVRFLINRQLHKVVESAPSGSPHFVHRSALVSFKPMQWAIKMQIGSMNKLEHTCDWGQLQKKSSFTTTSTMMALVVLRSAVAGAGR